MCTGVVDVFVGFFLARLVGVLLVVYCSGCCSRDSRVIGGLW